MEEADFFHDLFRSSTKELVIITLAEKPRDRLRIALEGFSMKRAARLSRVVGRPDRSDRRRLMTMALLIADQTSEIDLILHESTELSGVQRPWKFKEGRSFKVVQAALLVGASLNKAAVHIYHQVFTIFICSYSHIFLLFTCVICGMGQGLVTMMILRFDR